MSAFSGSEAPKSAEDYNAEVFSYHCYNHDNVIIIPRLLCETNKSPPGSLRHCAKLPGHRWACLCFIASHYLSSFLQLSRPLISPPIFLEELRLRTSIVWRSGVPKPLWEGPLIPSRSCLPLPAPGPRRSSGSFTKTSPIPFSRHKWCAASPTQS